MIGLIDAENDVLITVHALAKERLGREVSSTTIWRWINIGCHGCKLEAVRVLTAWHTTPEAFAAFLNGQTAGAMARGAARPGAQAATAGGKPAPRSAAKAARLKAAGLLK